jgi:phosphoribosyl-ATP pyrophosphohydrolase/phosphoribosyl-AMP cyclohydrolase/histidinol dehydrogenase
LKNGFAVLVRDLDEAVKIANQVAPEHLELLVKDLSQWEPKLKHYGALFVGTYAAEVLGDYGIGPNHTLPTSQTSKSSGGLSVFNFLRIRTVLRITGKEKLQTPEGRLVVEDAVELAKLEGLIGHSRSAEKRLFEVKTSDVRE